jgi:hypothetical protein
LDDVGLTKEDFFGVVKAHGLWPTKDQQKIRPFLNAWGLGIVETAIHKKIRFANFSEKKKAPMNDAFTGAAAASKLNPSQLYVVPTAEHPYGWDNSKPSTTNDSGSLERSCLEARQTDRGCGGWPRQKKAGRLTRKR